MINITENYMSETDYLTRSTMASVSTFLNVQSWKLLKLRKLFLSFNKLVNEFLWIGKVVEPSIDAYGSNPESLIQIL